MSGVTVSAKMDSTTITTSVFTDEDGAYYFPAMSAGHYEVWAQADGFEIARGSVDLAVTKQNKRRPVQARKTADAHWGDTTEGHVCTADAQVEFFDVQPVQAGGDSFGKVGSKHPVKSR